MKLKRQDFTFGQFGENVTVEGLADDDVRIGDRFRIGSATFEVTQPRVTCYRVGIRMNDPFMPTRLVAEGRPRFYLRVLVTGDVAAGDAIELIHRNDRGVTVAEVNAHWNGGPRTTGVIRAQRILHELGPPKYASLLEFAEACDAPTRWSCRAGVCHTCESGLISGDVRYEPVPLQAPAPGNVRPCSALPMSELVLDL